MEHLARFIGEEKLTVVLPVINPDGTILLYDMYYEGRWIGSRRLLKQCVEAYNGVRNASLS